MRGRGKRVELSGNNRYTVTRVLILLLTKFLIRPSFFTWKVTRGSTTPRSAQGQERLKDIFKTIVYQIYTNIFSRASNEHSRAREQEFAHAQLPILLAARARFCCVCVCIYTYTPRLSLLYKPKDCAEDRMSQLYDALSGTA